MASFCTNCAAALDTGTKFCAACGTATDTAAPAETSSSPRTVPVARYAAARTVSERSRYPVLRLIAVVLKVLAAIVAVFGVLGSLIAIGGANSGLGMLSGALGALVGLVVSLIWGLALWAWAELINVLVDIEHNTRMSVPTV